MRSPSAPPPPAPPPVVRSAKPSAMLGEGSTTDPAVAPEPRFGSEEFPLSQNWGRGLGGGGRLRLLPLLAFIAVIMSACVPTPPPMAPSPQRLPSVSTLVAAPFEEVGMHPGLGIQLDSIVEAAIADGAAPGAALAVGRYGRLVHMKGYGRLDWAEGSAPVTDSTIFDMASLTKVVATTTGAMILEEEGRLDLERTVREYLPEFDDPQKAPITLRMLLEHRGGLEAFARLFTDFRGREQYLQQINLRPLKRAPGTEMEYSDWDLILVQLAMERVTAQPLDAFLAERIFRPLGMRDTGFNPERALLPRIAPTERDAQGRAGHIHGEVHDPNAWAIGGVAGHAGLFSTARDLAVFAQMVLSGGTYGDTRIVHSATVARWTAPQGPGSSRALGWDTPSGRSSAGRFFSPRSFGHTGYTGTSIWMDPERGLFVILLTNRVNPTSDNLKIAPLRRAVADAVQGAILDAPLIDWEARRQ
ncbi:N/A [soil metagenome]